MLFSTPHACFYIFFFFFFNDTATTEIYTLSLHDALPIYRIAEVPAAGSSFDRISNSVVTCLRSLRIVATADRKSTRLNSSHSQISYAVFCLKKKKRDSKSYYVYISYYSPCIYISLHLVID